MDRYTPAQLVENHQRLCRFVSPVGDREFAAYEMVLLGVMAGGAACLAEDYPLDVLAKDRMCLKAPSKRVADVLVNHEYRASHARFSGYTSDVNSDSYRSYMLEVA